MNSISYIFLIKDEIIVPQSLEDENCGQIIGSLVEQGFFLSDVHLMSTDSAMALKMYREGNA